jgi:hypothetical protein
MLSDPNRLADFSPRCRQIAVAEYSIEAQAAGYVRLYEQLIGDARK